MKKIIWKECILRGCLIIRNMMLGIRMLKGWGIAERKGMEREGTKVIYFLIFFID
jgi:hypothetical protein